MITDSKLNKAVFLSNTLRSFCSREHNIFAQAPQCTTHGVNTSGPINGGKSSNTYVAIYR